MKKLLLTCLVVVVASVSVNAQTAKVKKQKPNTIELNAKIAADKKAADEALQNRKKQMDLDAQKAKTSPKKLVVKTTPASEEVISN